MATSVYLIDATSILAQADILEGSLKKSALTNRGKNLSVLIKLKNSPGTNLSQFSTISFEQTINALFLSIKIFT